MSTLIQLQPRPAQQRGADVRAGVRVEVVTVAWMVIEAIIAIGAGVLARSVLLTAFGFDSVIELVSGGRCSGDYRLSHGAVRSNGSSEQRTGRPGSRGSVLSSCAPISSPPRQRASGCTTILTDPRSDWG